MVFSLKQYNNNMTKDEKILKMAEMVGLVANLAPPLRDNFWDKFSEPKIDELQKDIYWKSLEAVKAIDGGETDCRKLAKIVYSNELLIKANINKLSEAIDEITKYFNDYIIFIYKKINDIQSENKIDIEKHIDIPLNEIENIYNSKREQHRKDLEKRFSNVF